MPAFSYARMVEVMSRLEQRIGDEDEPDLDLFLEEAVSQE
jgi:hypothetical protein